MGNNKPHIIALGSSAIQAINAIAFELKKYRIMLIDEEMKTNNFFTLQISHRYINSTEVNRFTLYNTTDLPDLEESLKSLNFPVLINYISSYEDFSLLNNVCRYLNKQNINCTIIACIPFSFENKSIREFGSKLLVELEEYNRVYQIDFDKIILSESAITIEDAYFKANNYFANKIKEIIDENFYNRQLINFTFSNN